MLINVMKSISLNQLIIHYCSEHKFTLTKHSSESVIFIDEWLRYTLYRTNVNRNEPSINS